MGQEAEPSETLVVDSNLFQTFLSRGKTEQALELSEEILAKSRRLNNRDFETEAWIRMERALLGAINPKEVGNELRWCVDRLASVNTGSPMHGLALLNLASWHRNLNEQMMALVTLSDISADAGHPVEVVGLSRLESGRILVSIGDLEPAMRHLWMAMRRLSSVEMPAEAVVCAMEWLDIALDDVDPESPTMDDRIVNAKPRESPGLTTSPSNPADIKESVEIILSNGLLDVSGARRDDLGLVLDASDALGEPVWRGAIEDRKKEIQDSRLIEVLQS
ncbi:MAG TPA: hypothetical protein EYQ11_00260 [Candidatus Poseidoniales archaeon]|jgi:hypothetical protein|nr:MAG: hypothetical protein CXT66_03525 [Euryarchaeota archaeon]HIG33302.1 hypothetical protein [Candidatus Poseidoniales archaeon]HIL67741.1 hypothetical protein [Candidatus Poseidoniales archaeon]